MIVQKISSELPACPLLPVPDSHSAVSLGVASPCGDTCPRPADFLWDGKHREEQ